MTVEAIQSGFLTNVIAADCNFLNNPLSVTSHCVPSLLSTNMSVIYVDVLFNINFRFISPPKTKNKYFELIYIHTNLVPKHSPNCNETLVHIVVRTPEKIFDG